MRRTGYFERTSVAGEEVAAFVPYPLPPRDPPLRIDDKLLEILRTAEHALARLELAGEMAPSIEWFIYAFVRKEAILSSQIEGTQATLEDLLTFEATRKNDARSEDVQEICNVLDAMNHALNNLRSPEGLPLSIRLLNDTHEKLLQGVRGAARLPGQIRRSQNWIGGTRPGNATFVPPPPHVLGDVLSDLERYIHEEDSLPRLIRVGLIHVQFETIHPYLDGNGRIGRLLIGLLLEHWGLLTQPLLYLSLFFKGHRQEYYRRLWAVRAEGDWEGWLRFFLEAVAVVAQEAIDTAKALFLLVNRDRNRLLADERVTVLALRLFELLPRHPVLTTSRTMELLSIARPTASKALSILESAAVLKETSGRQRDRTYAYGAYLDRLKVGTELW